MRKLSLTLVLIALLAMPVLAQFGFGRGMGGGLDATQLLANADVQKALKLSDEQKKTIREASTARQEAIKAAFQDMDREAMQKAQEEFTKVMSKVKDGLTSDQRKRLGEIEVQAAIQLNQPSIFKREHVQKALKLTDKQKEMVKESLSDLEKDVKEVMEDAKGDKEKFFGAFQKVAGMNKETFTKITKTLTDEQKKIWKEMQGEKFEGNLNPFGKGKFGKKKNKDDF